MFQLHECSFAWKSKSCNQELEKRVAFSSMEFVVDSLFLYELLRFCLYFGWVADGVFGLQTALWLDLSGLFFLCLKNFSFFKTSYKC